MSVTYTNPISAISYTNKDFQTIYPELLEAAKELARNWDPTISNESDPGVVLLKLNAIIADKNNYNIDKNILENYPETYTQDFSARSQYKQLGYRMPWYRAAKTEVSFSYVSKDDSDELTEGMSLTIPAYSCVADVDGEYPYTITESVSFEPSTDAELSQTVPAIQGILVNYKINGENKITLSNLDSRNRLYIEDFNIAENGIFVSSTSNIADSYEWTKVDNVEIMGYDSKCYEFDIDPMSGTPYLQFPRGIINTIGDGIYISYIVTSGESGNIMAKTLSKFYDTTTGIKTVDGQEDSKVTLTSENIRIENFSASYGGEDPETVEQAYYNFKKSVHSFNTLVTLRDYMNAIYNSDMVCNSVVSDRTTDISSHYIIMSRDSDSVVKYVDKVTTKETEYYLSDKATKLKIPTMNAFDLRLYLIGGENAILDMESYDKSFNLDISKTTMDEVVQYLDGEKSIQHDFISLPTDEPLLIFNKYPISMKIVPTYNLPESLRREVKNNIKLKLISLLNCNKCVFGKEPDYEKILESVINSDERIKFVILDDFKYTTYAAYIDKDTDDTNVVTTETGKGEVKIIPISNIEDGEMGIVVSEGPPVDPNPDDGYTYNKLFFSKSDNTFYKYAGTKRYTYSDKLLKFRKEILAKNIMAGITPLFTKDSVFSTNLLMKVQDDYTGDTKTLSTDLKLNLQKGEGYKVRENEFVLFTGPSFINKMTYSTYTKYLVSDNFNGGGAENGRCLDANATYELKKNEYIVFFSRGEGDDETPYDAYYYGEGTIIKPNFALYKFVPDEDGVTPPAGLVPSITHTDSTEYPIVSNVYSGTEGFNFIEDELVGQYSTSGSRQIQVCRMVQKKLTESDSKYYYVVSNDIQDNKYRMELNYDNPDKSDDSNIYRYSRVLGPDEFFIYMSNNQKQYEVLGEGTLIEYRKEFKDAPGENSTHVFENAVVPVTDIELYGITSFRKECTMLSGGESIMLSEQQLFSFVKDDIITFGGDATNKDGSSINIFSSDSSMAVPIPPKTVVSYTTGGTTKQLPIVELSDPYYCWRWKSYLNIKMDNETPFVLQKDFVTGTGDESLTVSSQRFKLPTKSEEYWNEGTPTAPSGELNVVSNIIVDKIGNAYTDISYVDGLGDRKTPSVLSYTLPKSNVNGVELNPETRNIEITLEKDAVALDLELFKDASYLMPVYKSSNYKLEVKVYYNNPNGSPFKDEVVLQCKSDDSEKDGIHYYVLDNPIIDYSAQEGSIDRKSGFISKISFKNITSDGTEVKCEVFPLTQIKHRTEYFKKYSLTEEEIISTIREFDIDNEFKYDYVPDEQVVISDPLSPASFFNEDNVFNGVCLPVAVLRESEGTASYLFLTNR